MLSNQSIESRNGIEGGLVFITTDAQGHVRIRHCKINLSTGGGQSIERAFNTAPTSRQAYGLVGFN